MFVSVKIALALKGELSVVASRGKAAMDTLSSTDIKVFENGKSIMMNKDDESITEECRLRASEYGIQAAYVLPLKSNSFTDKCLGILSIYTSSKDGFSKEDTNMLDELAGDIGFAVNSFMQQETIDALHEEKLQSYHEFIVALEDMIEQRDTYTAGHTYRVAQYSLMIAEDMGISEEDIKKLAEAARLHDIGKVVTPDSILLKPGALTNIEYELIQEHVTAGYQVLSNIKSYKELADIMIHHHERFDGSGYPHGRQKDEIPILGYILAVADSFDAMTTNRIYKPRKSVEESLKELKSLSGTFYHPDVVKSALKVLADIDVEGIVDQTICVNKIDQERLSYFFKDKLTRLYNEEYLAVVLNGRSNYEKPKTITIVSLIDFTAYNKANTWEDGNRLLTSFAIFLNENIKDNLIFRARGDNFLIANFDGDIDAVLANSPLADKGIKYRVVKMQAPFDELLRLMHQNL